MTPPETSLEAPPSDLISQRIADLADWRGATLARMRALIHDTVPDVVETWKWRGVPVWEAGGILYTGETCNIREGEVIDEAAFKALVLEEAPLNRSGEGETRPNPPLITVSTVVRARSADP